MTRPLQPNAPRPRAAPVPVPRPTHPPPPFQHMAHLRSASPPPGGRSRVSSTTLPTRPPPVRRPPGRLSPRMRRVALMRECCAVSNDWRSGPRIISPHISLYLPISPPGPSRACRAPSRRDCGARRGAGMSRSRLTSDLGEFYLGRRRAFFLQTHSLAEHAAATASLRVAVDRWQAEATKGHETDEMVTAGL